MIIPDPAKWLDPKHGETCPVGKSMLWTEVSRWQNCSAVKSVQLAKVCVSSLDLWAWLV